MGRTLATANQIILNEERAFANFRRTLRQADQQIFDALFAYAKKHTAAISQATHALPFETVLFAIALEQHKEIVRLGHRLDMLEKKQARPGSTDET